MKKILTLISLILIFAAVLTFASCDILLGKPVENPNTNSSVNNDGTINREGVWENATYIASTELGEGAKTVKVQVVAGGQSITFTINTDKETVGAALLEHKIIEGENGMYTKVNGITADYNSDQSYWSFYLNDAFANEGMDTTKIEKDATYKLEYTK